MNNFPILELKDIRKSYRMGNNSLEVLKGVDFRLEPGEWCCIFGASGSGKTTLLNIIGLLERPDAGEIWFSGVNAGKFNRRQAAAFRAKEIGFVFQSYHLLPELTIEENASLAGRLAGLTPRSARHKAAELLGRLGLSERRAHRPAELSGGEQQRAAIARALMSDPPLLLADEPTGNLDPRTGEEILNLFSTMREVNPEMAILMITHNHLIADRASRAVELSDGIFVPFEKK